MFCRRQLGKLREVEDEIRELGAELWVVSPDDAESLERMRQKKELWFPVLVDEGNQVVRRYGVLNVSNPEIPYPTALVIDEQGVIRWMRVDEKFRKRPPADDLVEALKGLER